MNEQIQKQEVGSIASRIIERWLVPSDGYQALDIMKVLESLGMQDNPANRSLVNEALKIADERSVKHSTGQTHFTNTIEALEVLGIKRKKHKK